MMTVEVTNPPFIAPGDVIGVHSVRGEYGPIVSMNAKAARYDGQPLYAAYHYGMTDASLEDGTTLTTEGATCIMRRFNIKAIVEPILDK